jgi:hypothetical protein
MTLLLSSWKSIGEGVGKSSDSRGGRCGAPPARENSGALRTLRAPFAKCAQKYYPNTGATELRRNSGYTPKMSRLIPTNEVN